eukprot:809501-Karenia_brevis.AAC.1
MEVYTLQGGSSQSNQEDMQNPELSWCESYSTCCCTHASHSPHITTSGAITCTGCQFTISSFAVVSSDSSEPPQPPPPAHTHPGHIEKLAGHGTC